MSCNAITKKGTQCLRHHMKDSKYCGVHSKSPKMPVAKEHKNKVAMAVSTEDNRLITGKKLTLKMRKEILNYVKWHMSEMYQKHKYSVAGRMVGDKFFVYVKLDKAADPTYIQGDYLSDSNCDQQFSIRQKNYCVKLQF